jgi:serine/threonine protein kinase
MTTTLANAMQPECLLALALGVLIVVAVLVRRGRREDAKLPKLGPYTLLEVLGEGAMGVVYRARHPKMDRPVALKVLPPDRCTAESAARFEREVDMTARLAHPNTIRILDYGCTRDGVLYYAMECLEGASLADAVAASGPMPAERVTAILDQIAGALDEAHGLGLIHRDVKPANIFLTDDAGAKLLDFGLVKQIGESEAGAHPSLTRAGSCTGTPLYMAPEVMTAPDRADGRTDLYALGAVGYFLLTGQHVFTGRSILEVCGHHLHSQPVPPSQRIAAPIPADLEDLLLSCLAKEPARRPASARAFQSALRACRPDHVADDCFALAA